MFYLSQNLTMALTGGTLSLIIQKELNMIKHKTHFNIQNTVEPRTYTYYI